MIYQAKLSGYVGQDKINSGSIETKSGKTITITPKFVSGINSTLIAQDGLVHLWT